MTCNHNCNHNFDCIKHVPIFIHLNEDEMKEISYISRHIKYKKSEMIYSFGEDGGKLYVVYKGNVKQFRLNENGKEQVIRIINPGEFFGELSLFSSLPLGDYAQALSDVEMCILEGKGLKNIMARYPEIAFKVMDELSRRLQEVENQIEAISLDSVDKRIAKALLDLSQESREIILTMSRADFASQLGMSQETLSRKLAVLQERGIILLEGHKKIIIQSRDKLELQNS